MNSQREHDIVRAFVQLSNDLVSEYDMVDLLSGLTANCAQLLDVAAAGLLLADARGALHVVAASSERTRHLEVFQVLRDEGPCLECFRTGEPVIAENLTAATDRWPQFVPVAAALGFTSVHAVPMRLTGSVLGALGLFGETVGPLGQDDLDLAQALAHVASVAIVNERAASDSAAVQGQLQIALTSRILLEQAKGVVANEGTLDMDEAFTVLRTYARDHGIKLRDVAYQVVTRTLSAHELLRHARRTSSRSS